MLYHDVYIIISRYQWNSNLSAQKVAVMVYSIGIAYTSYYSFKVIIIYKIYEKWILFHTQLLYNNP